MTAFLLNLVLALVWLTLTGKLSASNFALGFIAGYGVLRISRRALPPTTYFGKLPTVLRFGAFFVWELLRANLRVTHDILTRRHRMQPAVIGVPLDVQTDEEVVMLSTLITLTPGTLVLEISDDRRTLYIHAMYPGGKDEFRAEIKNGFERRVLELMR